jgi:hypothetical protein
MLTDPITDAEVRRVFGPFLTVSKHYGPGPHPGTMTDQSIHGRSSLPIDINLSLAEVDAKIKDLATDPDNSSAISAWAFEHISLARESLSDLYSEGITDDNRVLESRIGSLIQRLNNLYYRARNIDASSLVKHLGPGPHPGTNTPQSIHAGGAKSKLTDDTRPGIDDNPEFVRLASGLHQKAVALEPELSALFSDIADQTDGKLAGFDFRIKSERSIRDKIFRDLRLLEELGVETSPEQVALDIRDLNRYSIVWDGDEQWVDRHLVALELFRDRGWEIYDHKYKSAWAPGDHYDGTNIQLHNDGAFVELQLHTPESYQIKLDSDRLYAGVRTLPPEDPKRRRLLGQIHTLWNKSRDHVPPDAESLGISSSFMMKADPVLVYADPEGNPIARVGIRDGVVYAEDKTLSITPAEVDGLGGSADFLAETISKHFGPGPHPGTGTPQSIHAPGGGLRPEIVDPLIRTKHASFIAEFGEPENGFSFAAGMSPAAYSWLVEIQSKVYDDENLQAKWEDDIDSLLKQLRDIERENERDLYIRLAKGDISVEEATNLGLSQYDQEIRDLGPLPPVVYHVTTDTESVLKSGLKARDELSQDRGLGLGGGTANTISFTADEDIAQGILRGMKERHAVLNDPATHIPRLIEEAKAGTGADRQWWDRMGVKWEGDKSDALSNGGWQLLVEGKAHYVDSLGVGSVEALREKWTGDNYFGRKYDTDSIKLLLPEDRSQARRAIFSVDYTPAGHAEAVGDFMDEYAAYREGAKGPLDPLFISNDDFAFKNKPSDAFSIIKGTTKSGTQGYNLSALGEWRTWTGEVLEDIEVIR